MSYFCEYCGTKLKEKKIESWQYDINTGKKIIKIRYTCPKYRNIFTMHTSDFNPFIYEED